MSKEDELAKEQAEVVPNTYGDLHDAPVEYHTSRHSNN